MNFLNKMERRFGRYALTNLSLYIVLTYAAGYLLYMITPQVLTYMTLEPAMILRGQVWRIVSWLLIPPSTQNIFFILITLMFYYSIGTSQLLIDRRDEDLDEDAISEYITEHYEGNSLIVAGDEDLVKIHFHTNEPWKVLAYCNTIGEIYDIVIEDMIRQANGLQG